jgi:Fe-S oxidoreductase
MTTCPSSVHYMHLVDHARAYIEETYRRPLLDRALRRVLGMVLPSPLLFRAALVGAKLARPLAGLLPKRLRAMLDLAPAKIPTPSPVDRPQVFPAEGGATRLRVALLQGCAQQVLDPRINEATIRLLTRLGCEVAIADGSGCCGALTHHLGQTDRSHAAARRNIEAWLALWGGRGPDAIVVNASGCGTTVKDYGFMFRTDPAYADKAARVSALAKDVSEYLAAPTTSCNRISRSRCARARRRTSQGRVRSSSRPAISAASPSSNAPSACLSCTRSNCSTGRAAGRSRRVWREATNRGGSTGALPHFQDATSGHSSPNCSICC